MMTLTEQRNEFGLSVRDMKSLTEIFKKYSEIKEVRIFGSRAKGDYRIGSDLDLVIMNDAVPNQVLTNLFFDFDDSSLPYKIDLIYLPKLDHENLISHINRVGKVIYTA